MMKLYPNDIGSMLVTLFVVMPFLLYYFNLKERNASKKGELLKFWTTKGEGLLIGGSAIILFKVLDKYIIDLPLIVMDILIIFAFIPFLIKELGQRTAANTPNINQNVNEKDTNLPKADHTEITIFHCIIFAPIVYMVEKLPPFLGKHPILKKVFMILISPLFLLFIITGLIKEACEQTTFKREVLKDTPSVKWNYNKVKKEMTKARQQKAKAMREAEKQQQILERQNQK